MAHFSHSMNIKSFLYLWQLASKFGNKYELSAVLDEPVLQNVPSRNWASGFIQMLS